jgi:hypothetical protein
MDVLRLMAVCCAVLQGLVLHEDLKARMRVLRRLGYIDSGAVVAERLWYCAHVGTATGLVMHSSKWPLQDRFAFPLNHPHHLPTKVCDGHSVCAEHA